MENSIFTDDGHIIIPQASGRHGTVGDNEERHVVGHAYCTRGCSIIDGDNLIHGCPGLRMSFSGPSTHGEFVLSPILGDFEKVVLEGELVDGVKLDLCCPHCGTPFPTLVNCSCSHGGDIVAVGLTSPFSFNDAVAFCNVVGCKNGVCVHSGRVLRAVGVDGYY